MIKNLLLSLLFLTSCTPAMAAITPSDMQLFKDIQLIQNSNFENGVTKWSTPNAGTLTSQSATKLYGHSAGQWAITSGTGEFHQDATGIGTVNMSASCWMNTSASTFQVCPRSGGTTLTNQCQSVIGNGQWQNVITNFIGPASGTVGVQVKTSGATTGTAFIGKCSVGPASNISQVSQAQFLGSMTVSDACTWQTTSGSLAAFSASSPCTQTMAGSALAPSSQIPAITFASLAPGNYKLEVQGNVYNTTAGVAQLQFFDGTNFAKEPSVFYSSSGELNVPGISETFTYTTPQTNVTFSLYGKTGSGTLSLNEITINVYYFPSQAQTVVSGACASSGSCVNHFSANIDGSGNVTAQNVPFIVSSSYVGGGNFNGTFKTGVFGVTPICLITPIGVSTAIITGTSTTAFSYVTANNGGATNSPVNITCDKQGADISSFSAPIIIGGLSTNSSGADMVGRAAIAACATSPCTITSQSGNWVSSVTRSGAGGYTVNYSGFSAAPTCTVNTYDGSSGALLASIAGVPSSSALQLQTFNTAFSQVDTLNGFNVICVGPR